MSIWQPPLPKPGQRIDWQGVPGSAAALAISRLLDAHKGVVTIVTDNQAHADQLLRELRFFADGDVPLLHFPDWEVLPYDVFSPHQDIVSERINTLYQLPLSRHGVLITPINTLLQRLAPPSYFQANGVSLAVGQQLDMLETRRQLESAGYLCVPEVHEHGEFAVRGSILDLFPMGADAPIRIDLFDDEIDSLRWFDPDSQLSQDKTDRIDILPAREFPTDEAAITAFRARYRASFEGDPQRSLIYSEVSAGHLPNGLEFYLPLFFDETATLFDYLPGDALVVRYGDLDTAAGQHWDNIEHRYEQRRHDIERPLLAPERLFLRPTELGEALNRRSQIVVRGTSDRGEDLGGKALPDVALDAHAEDSFQKLRTFLQSHDGRTLLVAESPGRRETLLERFTEAGIKLAPFDHWRDFLDADASLAIAVGGLDEGALLSAPAIAIVPESALYGERASQRRRRRKNERDPDAVVRHLTELQEGAPVVHELHGVGRYVGLQTLTIDSITQEFVTLAYAGEDKLYVPVSSLHLISRYTGAENDSAPLHRLGGEQWEKAKRKAREKIRDVAAELLDIYARREAQKGRAHDFDLKDYQHFADSFPFEETPDQETAIAAVLADLRGPRPMDRVVCGDVGFGKTEVAMRAAFAGVQAGGQVAVLVPTTLLAQQHYQNFSDRMADWPIRVDVLSRFRQGKEQQQTLAAVEKGDIDILIGTHKLLQGDLKFKNLTLLIVDEEHRFGVRQKEVLKTMRANLDVLTLTATPIPRTLNMSLSGLRDLSIIATPPAKRLAVKTFVNQWNDALIQEACERELRRGGQVYFLHNDVETIERTARELEALVPEARVRVAHGQMRERELEQVMLDFYHQRFNILVCTTIVESGIDVPSANTMVINRADRLGLAQLHQLRGRVGRSHHRAYCYLISPPKKQLTGDAAKRLEAISHLEDLGVGFSLASHDLEIRGAGELLGEGQSGQIHEIGFSLYSELLERAVKALQSGKQPELDAPLHHSTEIDLRLPALLPDDYLPDVHTRLVMYKRIANADSDAALRELQVEMIDRFGLLPEPAKNLFRLGRLRNRATALGIKRIELGPKGGHVLFDDEPNVDLQALIGLVQKHPGQYRFEGQEKLRVLLPLEEHEQRFSCVEALLAKLANKKAA